jgi:hypothetical protein
MSVIQHLSLNNQSVYRWSNLYAANATCANKMQIDVPTNGGFSRQEQTYFITPPCNYKLR